MKIIFLSFQYSTRRQETYKRGNLSKTKSDAVQGWLYCTLHRQMYRHISPHVVLVTAWLCAVFV